MNEPDVLMANELEKLMDVNDRTALTLRGMTMDPRIPDEVKEVLKRLYTDLEAANEAAGEWL